MTCLHCGGRLRVVDVRSDCEAVYRRRMCVDCGYTFYTTEIESKDNADIARIYRQLYEERKRLKV